MTHPTDDPRSFGLPREGDVVDARFAIEHELGVGGMGGVFAARDVRNDRRVALKLMLPHLTRDAQLVARFVREAKTMSSLRSEHVARVFEVGRAGRAPYMVMELLEGQDLQAHMRADPRMPLSEVVRCVIEACDAIAEAHQRGVVHRDLKPSNLFLAKQAGSTSKVKVLDFGISKQISLDALPGAPATQLTATDAVLGSPLYMAPEQLRSSKSVDRRADLWALGVILHKCLTGSLPFAADSLGAYFCAVAAEPPRPLRDDRPDAPAGLESAVLRCLQRDLSLRFQNVGQLVLALAPFAPPAAKEVVERIVGVVGRDASTKPLPPLPPLPAHGGELDADDPPTPIVVRDETTRLERKEARSRGVGRVDSVEAATVPGRRAPRGAAPVDATYADATTLRWERPAARPRQLRQRILPVSLAVAALVAAAVGAQRMLAGSVRVIPAATAVSITAPALPSEVTLTIDVAPKGAIVELDGVRVLEAAVRLPRGDAPHALTVQASGYETETRAISAQGDTAVVIALKPEASASSTAAPPARPASTPRPASLPRPAPAASQAPPPAASQAPPPAATPTVPRVKGLETTL